MRTLFQKFFFQIEWMRAAVGGLSRSKVPWELTFVFAIGTTCFLASYYWPWPDAHRSVTRFGLERPRQSVLSMFYPAVFFAGGHGMGTTNIETIPGLEDFVFGEAPAFDLDNIPDATNIVPLSTPFELTHLYLLYGVGIFWRFFGVSINTLHLFAAFLCALCGCALYALFRVGLNRALSFVGALAVCLSPMMIHCNLDLRDYGKGPFFLGLFCILGHVTARTMTARQLIAIAALMGIVLGVGIGVRTDLMICLLPAVVSLVFFSRITGKGAWGIRMLSVAAFIVLFLVAARPILRGMAADNGQQLTHHSYFMGLSVPYEQNIGDFGGASYTDFSFPDEVIIAMVNAYARRMGSNESFVNPRSSEYMRVQGDLNGPLPVDPLLYYRGPEYGRMGRRLMQEYHKLFPADLVVRAWCAVAAVIKMHDANNSYGGIQNVSSPGWLEYLFMGQEKLAAHWGRFGVFYTILCLMGISVKNLRLALIVTFLLAWFGGSTSLSFQGRHVFHLAFVPMFAMLTLAAAAGRVFLLACNADERRTLVLGLRSIKSMARPASRALLYAALIFSGIAAPASALRMYQSWQIQQLADRLASKTLIPLETTVSTEDGTVLIQPADALPGLEELPHGEAAWAYLAITFNLEGHDIPVAIEYGDEDADRLMLYGNADDNSMPTTLYFPVYEIALFPDERLIMDTIRLMIGNDYKGFPEEEVEEGVRQMHTHRRKLAGVSFPEEHKDSFVGFYLVENTDDLRILPFMQVPENHAYIRAYKTCAMERKLRRLFGHN